MGERLEVGQRRRWTNLPMPSWMHGHHPADGKLFVVESINNPRKCRGRYVDDRAADFVVAERYYMESYSTIEPATEAQP